MSSNLSLSSVEDVDEAPGGLDRATPLRQQILGAQANAVAAQSHSVTPQDPEVAEPIPNPRARLRKLQANARHEHDLQLSSMTRTAYERLTADAAPRSISSACVSPSESPVFGLGAQWPSPGGYDRASMGNGVGGSGGPVRSHSTKSTHASRAAYAGIASPQESVVDDSANRTPSSDAFALGASVSTQSNVISKEASGDGFEAFDFTLTASDYEWELNALFEELRLALISEHTSKPLGDEYLLQERRSLASHIQPLLVRQKSVAHNIDPRFETEFVRREIRALVEKLREFRSETTYAHQIRVVRSQLVAKEAELLMLRKRLRGVEPLAEYLEEQGVDSVAGAAALFREHDELQEQVSELRDLLRSSRGAIDDKASLQELVSSLELELRTMQLAEADHAAEKEKLQRDLEARAKAQKRLEAAVKVLRKELLKEYYDKLHLKSELGRLQAVLESSNTTSNGGSACETTHKHHGVEIAQEHSDLFKRMESFRGELIQEARARSRGADRRLKFKWRPLFGRQRSASNPDAWSSPASDQREAGGFLLRTIEALQIEAEIQQSCIEDYQALADHLGHENQTLRDRLADSESTRSRLEQQIQRLRLQSVTDTKSSISDVSISSILAAQHAGGRAEGGNRGPGTGRSLFSDNWREKLHTLLLPAEALEHLEQIQEIVDDSSSDDDRISSPVSESGRKLQDEHVRMSVNGSMDHANNKDEETFLTSLPKV
ncbi:hypothetical protein FVE85_1885 [Porphyridium purpureum]|uniref:Uncharacterized protein n=1 Tax=Porphyridium purpureum TaxID=35688 RepID=A0A5J4YXQ5_PORPP|nr:hypothetical protein FVE85_1885 [Porphyridium purpureum]|eukprot:POR7048..scf209_3